MARWIECTRAGDDKVVILNLDSAISLEREMRDGTMIIFPSHSVSVKGIRERVTQLHSETCGAQSVLRHCNERDSKFGASLSQDSFHVDEADPSLVKPEQAVCFHAPHQSRDRFRPGPGK